MKKYVKASAVNTNTTDEPLNDMVNNLSYQRIAAVAGRCGYILDSAYKDQWSNVHLSIHPGDYSRFIPEIHISGSGQSRRPKVNSVSARIQTTSYGSLNIDEFNEFLDCCKDAATFANFLNTFDEYDQLYEIVED